MATAISTIGMDKDEWLAVRQKQGIGASEIAPMMGLSQYKTPYQVWIEKTASDVTETPDTPAMKRGRMLEEIVAQMYAEESGDVVRKDNKIRVHPECEQVFASLDRTIVDKEDGNGPGVLECKTVSAWAFKNWETDIPIQYYLQVQQQLAVTGYTWGVIAVLNIDTWELTVVRFDRDEKMIATILAEVDAWWKNYVIPEIEPPMTAVDFSKIFRDDEAPIVATEEIKVIVSNLAEVKAKIKDLTAIKESLEETLKEFYGVKNVLVDTDGSIIGTWKTQHKKEYVVKASTSRVMRFKKQSSAE